MNTIQSGIDAITFGGAVGGSVEVSSGASTENVICSRQNYTLAGLSVRLLLRQHKSPVILLLDQVGLFPHV